MIDLVAAGGVTAEQLLELDRERRRMRSWMATEDSGHGVDPPIGSVGHGEG